ncbi:MAG: vWA domain-containing protein, partial [Ardenticatenaceae bacterium]
RFRKLAIATLGLAAFGMALVACSSSDSAPSASGGPQSEAPGSQSSPNSLLPPAPPSQPDEELAQMREQPGKPLEQEDRDTASSQPMPPSQPVPAAAATTMQGAGYGITSEARGFSTGGSATVNDAPYDATFFKHYGVNPFIDTEDDHFSTFAMDVDTASYAVARRFIQDGFLPDPDSVRVEEFINFFDQGYHAPEEDAFAIHIDGAPSPFSESNHWLMRVGLQGRTIEAEERKDASLIFVIDVSGSMARENRLGLVQRSLHLLLDKLRPADEVGIVVYGSSGRVLLEPTSLEDIENIREAIDALRPDGSTNASEGLLLGYEMAIQTVEPGRITRVLLLSDGVANVGNTGSDSILRTIRQYVDEGVYLSTVGFGMGNFNDILMEQLANDGNGHYAYVDTLNEANRVFVENLTGTLQVIAQDSKIQVDFNPEVVSRWRLLGYENRDVADRDFRNDLVDAGEVGAGHSVTALYELKLHEGAEGSLGTVFVRYEDPDTFKVTELSREMSVEELALEFEEANPRLQLAAVVAEYAEILRESFWAKESSLTSVAEMAHQVMETLPEDADVAEFVQLVDEAKQIVAKTTRR